MINMPCSPGNSPWQTVGTNYNGARQKWGDCIQVPLNLNNNASGEFTDSTDVVDPVNAGHAQYLKDFDPRHNHGKSNPLNPNSPNYNNYNPAVGRRDYL